MKNWKLSALLNTPLRMSIMVGAIVLGAEYLFMRLLREVLIPTLPFTVHAWDVIDAVILATIVTPVLYFAFRKTQENEGRFRQINEASPSAIVIVNKQGLITDWNPAAQRIFLYSMEEAMGQQMHQLLAPPRYHDDAVRGFARFEETGDGPLIGKVSEISALRKDGSEFPIELSLASFKLKREWHAVGVIRDITERKLAESKLRESELRFQQMTTAIEEVFWIAPPDCQSMLYISPAFEKIWGRSCADLYAHPQLWVEMIHPEDVPRVLHALEKLAQGVPYSIEFRILRPDGSVRWINDRGYALRDDSGEVSITTGISLNITERKQTEIQLTEQLEELRRWHAATLGREGRILVLKHEINELLAQAGQPLRYPSAESQDQTEE